MKYCRFNLNGQTHYGAVEDRNGELWIIGPAATPEEDLPHRLQQANATPSFAPMPL